MRCPRYTSSSYNLCLAQVFDDMGSSPARIAEDDSVTEFRMHMLCSVVVMFCRGCLGK